MKKVLQGIGSSAGKAKGKARIVLEKSQWPNFRPGDILVTKITDPTMVPLLSKAGGIVCDIGGVMSHPSIVAREMGIPCIVGTKQATTLLKQNQLVEIDGTTGEVFLVE